MKVQYSKHAEGTLEEREIARETVEELIRKPQQVIKGKGNKQIVQGIMNRANQEFLLRVVYIEEEGMTKVITAYWTSKIDKYWEGSR
ncbi:DUF4258 domain-containing protein [Candidatus Bipolaricaulota bacterium]|jgi:hypothetical protein|nr:DUF4258 domain-containing protein [Candidatus Bipolaricaulota bacterium]